MSRRAVIVRVRTSKQLLTFDLGASSSALSSHARLTLVTELVLYVVTVVVIAFQVQTNIQASSSSSFTFKTVVKPWGCVYTSIGSCVEFSWLWDKGPFHDHVYYRSS